MPIIEDYFDRYGSLESELDVEQLNDYYETELNSFQKGFKEFLDDR